MTFFECTRENPFIASPALDAEYTGVGLRVVGDQYITKSRNRDYGSFINLYHLLAVRGRAKEEIQSAGLKGLRLLELQTTLEGGTWPDGIEPLYLIWSDYILPPTASELIDRHSRPVDRSAGGFSYPDDGCYLKAGPLASLEYVSLERSDFDIGVTFENFGGRWDCYRRIVYSQKAAELLQKLMTKLRLRPVINKGEPVAS